MARSPGRPRGRDWFDGCSHLLALLASAARDVALDPREPPLKFAAVAARLGKATCTVQEVMREQTAPLEWLPIRRGALRLRFPRITAQTLLEGAARAAILIACRV